MRARFRIDAGRIVRGVIGVIIGAIGAAPLALVFAGVGPLPMAAALLGATMLLIGLLLLVGAVAGVDDNGNTPATAPGWLRVLVGVIGALAFICFAATFTSIAFLPELGEDALIMRLGFGGFSLLLWAGVIGGLLTQLKRGQPAPERGDVFAAIPWGVRVTMALMGLLALAMFALIFSMIALGLTSTPVQLSLPIPAEWLGGAGQVIGRLIFAAGAALWWWAFAVLALAAWRGLRPPREQ